MALDVGERRIGVALSDPLGSFAQPHATVAVEGRKKDVARLVAIARDHEVSELVVGRKKDVARLVAIARDHEVSELVVGLPLHMHGEEGEAAQKARRLGNSLAAALGLAVTYWDERLTTVQAERTLIEGGVRRRDRKAVVDQVAAVLILQAYLDSRAAGAGDDFADDDPFEAGG